MTTKEVMDAAGVIHMTPKQIEVIEDAMNAETATTLKRTVGVMVQQMGVQAGLTKAHLLEVKLTSAERHRLTEAFESADEEFVLSTVDAIVGDVKKFIARKTKKGRGGSC